MSKAERVVVLGAGAVGCTVAAALCEAGRVPALVARAPFARLSRTLEGNTAEFAVDLLSEPGEAIAADHVLLCTKAYQADSVGHWLRALVADHTTLAVLQNGVDQVERLSAFAAPEQIVPVVVQMACERLAPGAVKQVRRGRLTVPAKPASDGFAGLFDGTGALQVIVEQDFVSALWRKLALNATSGAIGALTLRANGVMGEPAIRAAARSLMQEAVAVGEAEGAEFAADFIERTLDTLAGPVAEHWSSIAADRRDGRPLEWEVRNAVVGRLGRRHGIDTPLSDFVTALLSAAR